MPYHLTYSVRYWGQTSQLVFDTLSISDPVDHYEHVLATIDDDGFDIQVADPVLIAWNQITWEEYRQLLAIIHRKSGFARQLSQLYLEREWDFRSDETRKNQTIP